MGKIIYDYSTGEPTFALDDRVAITQNGDCLVRAFGNIAGDLSGAPHFTSDWESDDNSLENDDCDY